MSESLTEPRTNVNECSNPLHDFCKQNTSGQDPFVIPYLSVSELGKYISRLENKTSSGLDGISNQLLKLSFLYVIDSLTYVFNLCIEKNVFPSELKKTKVVPLPEPTDKTNPTNYRPISLLSVLSKLLEKHVHIYLNDYLEKRPKFCCHKILWKKCQTDLPQRTSLHFVAECCSPFRSTYFISHWVRLLFVSDYVSV